jgi:hypothetical protein
LIDLRDGKLVGDSRFRNNPESTYGFVQSALDTDSNGTKLSDWLQYKEGGWRSLASAENGRYAEISFVQDGETADRKVYSITVKNGDNREGSIESYQFYGKFDDAKMVADEFVSSVAPEATKAATAGPRV